MDIDDVMELKQLRIAIESYQMAREAINEFLKIYEDELSSLVTATLGNHHYYVSSLIAEIQEIIKER